MGFSCRRYGWVSGLAVALLTGRTAFSATATLAPSKDNTLYESSTGRWSNGHGQHFFSGVTNSGADAKRRGLISFDVAANVPAGSTIQSANLTLHMSRTSGGALTISLHKSLTGWGEGDSVASGNEGGGAPAAQGDATWLHAFYNSSFWSTPGGDFNASASASLPIAGVGFYSWPSTEGLVRDLQSWLDAPQTNRGWVLVADDESILGTAKAFDTRENQQAEFRPVLEVVFAPPVLDAGFDGGPTDGGPADGGGPDGGAVDAGPTDSGQPGGTEPPGPGIGHGCATVPGSGLPMIAALLLLVWRRSYRCRISRTQNGSPQRAPAAA